MSQEDVNAVRLGFEAFNSEDIERVLPLFHRDFEAVVPPELSAEPDIYRGHDGLRRYFQSFHDAMDEVRFHPEQLWDAGQSVVVAVVRLTAKGRQTEIPVEQRIAQVWSIRDGKPLRVLSYPLLSEALEAAGLPAKSS